jgi:hypothetical protein
MLTKLTICYFDGTIEQFLYKPTELFLIDRRIRDAARDISVREYFTDLIDMEPDFVPELAEN